MSHVYCGYPMPAMPGGICGLDYPCGEPVHDVAGAAIYPHDDHDCDYHAEPEEW